MPPEFPVSSMMDPMLTGAIFYSDQGGSGGAGSGDGGGSGSGGTGAGDGGGSAGGASGSSGTGSSGDGAKPGDGTDADKLDEEARAAELKRARDEAAKSRSALREKEEAEAEFKRAIAKALGLETGEEADPEKLQALVKEKDSKISDLEADLHTERVRNRVQEVAVKEGVEFRLLFGHLQAEKKLATIDLDADEKEISKTVERLVQEAVKEFPSLRGGQAPRRSGTDLSGGSQDPSSANMNDLLRAGRR